MSTVTLYRVTTTYSDPYFNDYWSLAPASNEVHPDTDLSYDRYTDGGPVKFLMPDGFEVAQSVLGELAFYDANGNHAELSDAYNGEPMLIALGGFVVLNRAE